MNRNQLVILVVLVAFIAGVPALCGAQSARVIPKGTLSVFENGKPVAEFKSEVPLPQGASLVCSGECLVQGEKFQFVVHDKAHFSLAQKDKVWVLTVKSGTVEFSIGKDAELAFVTPKGKYEVTKVIPANGLVRGRVDVTETGTEFATAAGVLYLASADGVQVIEPRADADAPYAAAAPFSSVAIPLTTVGVVAATTAAVALTTQPTASPF
jgi:hypothetical protein